MNRKYNQIKGIVLVGVVLSVCLMTALALSPLGEGRYSYRFKPFLSYDELVNFLRDHYEESAYDWLCEDGSPRMFSKSPGGASINGQEAGVGSADFSKTNIQVEGVDEPDMVKTDGTYLYIVADSQVFIVRAYPAEHARVVSTFSPGDDVYLSTIFINGDRLIVFGGSYRYPEEVDKGDYWWGGIPTTVVTLYDISDKENPEIITDVEVDGNYFDARMIGDIVYVIVTEYSSYIYRVMEGKETVNLPVITVDDVTEEIPVDQIYYADIPDSVDIMTHVVSVNIDDATITESSFLTGGSHTLYVSKNNIYLTYTKYEPVFPPVRSVYGNDEETIIYKISIKDGEVSYSGQGEVPGRVLNQFSMDEYNGYFRIATTIGNVWDTQVKSRNNVYILDQDLNRVSEIEDIAPGERIYSARFMGDKAYLVTFKKVDPFFTLDLSDQKDPKIIGKLKIPGYSDYLHPYDEDHIIGVGKDTVEALDSEIDSRGLDFAWYQGLKIALFDVSDFGNPQELAKVMIGDRGTSSLALYDHKSFLFDREKHLLVIPVSVCEISDEIKEQYGEYTGNLYGEFTFQGAYVYDLSLENGFEYKGRITHMDDDDFLKSGSYGYYDSSSITRALYIGDFLYTISESKIKLNNLDTLDEIATIELL
jgi:uncharacterized secreted protein with C-terminal beta-propeller domain